MDRARRSGTGNELEEKDLPDDFQIDAVMTGRPVLRRCICWTRLPTMKRMTLQAADQKHLTLQSANQRPLVHLDSMQPLVYLDSKQPLGLLDSKQPQVPLDSKQPLVHLDSKNPLVHLDSKNPLVLLDNKPPVLRPRDPQTMNSNQRRIRRQQTAEGRKSRECNGARVGYSK